jgi:hypothetical protein
MLTTNLTTIHSELVLIAYQDNAISLVEIENHDSSMVK